MKKSSEKIHHAERTPKVDAFPVRLRQAIRAMGYRRTSQFIRALGVNPSTVYAVLSRQTKEPGIRFLYSCYMLGLNLNWLISGEGEMFVERSQEEGGAESGEGAAYARMAAPQRIERKIRDAMDDVRGLYQQLGAMQEYVEVFEKLDDVQRQKLQELVAGFLSSHEPENRDPETGAVSRKQPRRRQR